MQEKIIGVYQIKNLVNGKMYIGSSIDINSRWKEHIRDLNNNKHHSLHLQRAWNKYGESSFEFNVLEECNEDTTLEREQYYLDKLESFKRDNGYNVSKSSSAPMMGRKHSKETKIKISEEVRSRDSSCWVRGEDKFNAKFKDEDIINIKRLIYEGNRTIDIAKLYNVEGQTITQIKTGDRWNHIKTEYDDLIIQTPRQKLNEEDIIEIKKLLVEEKLNIIEIADIFGITPGMISSIKNLNSWEDIGKEYNYKLKNRLIVNKLDKNKVIEIKKLLLEGKSCTEISEIYNVTPSTIAYIRQNKTWRNVKIDEEDKLRQMYSHKRIQPSSRISIVQLSIEGEFIKEWESSSEASKALNFNASGITACCKRKYNTSKGYIWMYKSEYESNLKEVG
ncbi:MAG: GIY-YIG nuclease family protein [Bacilli bacterium]|nr:GIY-YIG nuclease family protein [Bacilli bacterium]